MNRSLSSTALAIVIAAGIAFAQDSTPQPAPLPPASQQTLDAYGQPIGAQPEPPPQATPAYGVPPEVTLRPGSYITVRVNQEISSTRNQPGDAFSATLAQPVVVDGVVLAQRGQTVIGRVSDAQKSRGGKRAQLALELTELTFADGSQGAIRSQELIQDGPRTPPDQQVNTVANTTLVGAMVGNAINWRSGGAIGAAVGAGAGLATIMVTRNRPSVVYPESVLTFQVESPVTVATGRAPGAFRYADSSDYQGTEPPRLERRDRNCRGCGPRQIGYPMGYPPYGPTIGVGIGWGRGGRW
jgi:hypothetical protein